MGRALMVSAFSGVHCNQSPVLDAIKTLRQLGAPDEAAVKHTMTIENHIAQMILSCREVGNEFDHAVTPFGDTFLRQP
jgi:hypothetical protein